jgi:hypothetical protein
MMALALLVPVNLSTAPTLEELHVPDGVQLNAEICAAVARYSNQFDTADRFQPTTWFRVPSAVFRLHPADEAALLRALRSPNTPPDPSLASELLSAAVLRCCARPLGRFYDAFQQEAGIRLDRWTPTARLVAEPTRKHESTD